MLVLVLVVGVNVVVGVCVYKSSNIRQYAHDVFLNVQLTHPEMPTITNFVWSACLTVKLAYIYRHKRR
jgi:hypothetical protein